MKHKHSMKINQFCESSLDVWYSGCANKLLICFNARIRYTLECVPLS